MILIEKTNKWRLRGPKTIVHVLPRYSIIPSKDAPSYIDFCRVELLLYKPFRNISSNIGNSNEDFVANWEHRFPSYKACNVDHHPSKPLPLADENLVDGKLQPLHPTNLDEWEMLSQIHPTNDIQVNHLDMLGLLDFDKNHNWNDTIIPFNLQEIAIPFITNNCSNQHLPHPCHSNSTTSNSLSPNQTKALNIILNHSRKKSLMPPLRMIVKGIAGTKNPYWLHALKNIFPHPMIPRKHHFYFFPYRCCNIQHKSIHNSWISMDPSKWIPPFGRKCTFQPSRRTHAYLLHSYWWNELSWPFTSQLHWWASLWVFSNTKKYPFLGSLNYTSWRPWTVASGQRDSTVCRYIPW